MRLLNADSLQISEIISVAYGCIRCGVALGLPVSCDWPKDDRICIENAFVQIRLIFSKCTL